jgi:hypothetical protein
MNAAEYEEFTAVLLRRLQADPDVLGMVALGTTADPTYRDAWSDHDFWVVTRPGHQDVLLDDLSWLPHSGQILIATRHGRRHYSVLYRDGHLAEFAVFDPVEAATGAMTVGDVLFDRADVAGAVARAQERAHAGAWDAAKRAFVFDNFLILLRTAVARWQRGERLSARRYLAQFAVDSLLGLALEYAPATVAGGRDAVDPRRRIERLQPHLAEAVEALAGRPVPEGAVGLLDLAEETLAHRWPQYPASRAAAVRTMLTSALAEPSAG